MHKMLQLVVVAGTLANLVLAIDRFAKETRPKYGFQAGFAAIGFMAALNQLNAAEIAEAE